MAALIELDSVVKQYPGPDGRPGPLVLDGVDMRLEAGESMAITGPSGSGKSTLLNILGALDRPTSGSVRLDGQELSNLGEGERASIRNRQIGFVFQLHHLLAQCSALENVLVPTLAGDAAPDAAARAAELLRRVGLGERLAYRPAELSGGERQRVAVVRALINRPKLLLADEPTGSLDRDSAEDLARLLVDLNRQGGVALVVVTHSPELAGHMARAARLIGGKLREGQ